MKHDEGWHTLPKEVHGNFMAMYQGRGDGLEEVFNVNSEGHGNLMVIPAFEGVVYITKEQAMKFFNLVEA